MTFEEFHSEIVAHNVHANHPLVHERILFRLQNGVAVSVIRGPDTYGGPDLWELARLTTYQDSAGVLTYKAGKRDLSINKDLHGWLTGAEVVQLLRFYEKHVQQIKEI